MSPEKGKGRVLFGVDRLLKTPGTILESFGPGARIALLTNDGSRAGAQPSGPQGTEPTHIALLKAGVPLVRLFTPEHGLSASAPDGVAVPHGTDARTGLPVTSLYGTVVRPDGETLEDLDLILVDLQDIGVRFYTYLWTLSHLMEACAHAGVPVWILDRPNPLGGKEEWVEGPIPDGGSPATFLCRWPIPIRHSLTLGELALLLRAEIKLDMVLKVVAMEGWHRGQLWPETGLPFHPPSPGIPSHQSALLYPGLALLEATNVLEGRGTELAFRWLGTPWMDEKKMAAALNRVGPAGVRAHPHALETPNHPSPCPGVILEITDPRKVRPVALGLRLLSLLLTLWPDRFSWTPYPTAVNPSGGGHLLRLLARSDMVETFERTPESVDDHTIRLWTRAPGWWSRAGPHLLYD